MIKFEPNQEQLLADILTYRIVTEKGTVDFSKTYVGIMAKHFRYAQEVVDGHIKFVEVLWEDPRNGTCGPLFRISKEEAGDGAS